MLDRLLVEGDERGVERVLDDAGVAPRGAGGDRLALVDTTLEPASARNAASEQPTIPPPIGDATSARGGRPAACAAPPRARSSAVFTLATQPPAVDARDRTRATASRRERARRSDASAASASRSTGSWAGS